MKKFVVKLENKQKHLFNQELLIKHVEHLKQLTNIGVLETCGPCEDGSAIMILKSETIEKAKEYVEADPFSKINYYQSRIVTEFLEATMDNNFWL